MHTSTMHTVI